MLVIEGNLVLPVPCVRSMGCGNIEVGSEGLVETIEALIKTCCIADEV